MWGHGVRERQQRGPLEPFGEPVTVVVQVRRYLCRACRAVVQVVPRGLLALRSFSAAAIGLALTLFGVRRCAMAAVRERVSPWRRVGASARASWLALRRWVRAIREQRLFTVVRAAPDRFTARQMAEGAAMTLAALAPDLASDALEARVFAGAARAR